MPKYKSEDLLNELITDVRRIRESAEFFQSTDQNKLAYSTDKGTSDYLSRDICAPGANQG